MKIQSTSVCLLVVNFLSFTVLALEALEKEVSEVANTVKSGNSEKSDKLLRRGFKNWEERCLVNGGEQVLADYLSEQENLVYCMMEQFDVEEIQYEVETNKETGKLDEVFKKYCSSNVPAARECLSNFLSVSALCLEEDDQPGLNVTMAMVDSAIKFACHRDGDRIALFVSEEGVECVMANKDELFTCVKKSVPEIFSPYHHRRRNHNKMHFYVFQQENCRKGDAIIDCVEKSLLKCDDPTPSNLLHGMLKSMRDVTPCTTSSSFSINNLSLLTELCLLCFCCCLLYFSLRARDYDIKLNVRDLVTDMREMKQNYFLCHSQ